MVRLGWVLRGHLAQALSPTQLFPPPHLGFHQNFVFNRLMRTIEDYGLLNAPFIVTLNCIHSWNTDNILLPCTLIKEYIKTFHLLKAPLLGAYAGSPF